MEKVTRPATGAHSGYHGGVVSRKNPMSLPPIPDSLFVAIFSSEGGEAGIIAAAVAAQGWHCVLASSRAELERALREQACNGVVLAIPSLLKLGPSDKEFIMALEPGFPVARVRCGADGALVAMSAYTGVTPSLDDFLEICKVWPKRRMRNADRHKLNLNVVLACPGQGFGGERTFTVDVSQRGCFLASAGPWAVGDPVQLAVQEAASPLLLLGAVMRQVPWGTRYQAPGIGIQFEPLDEDLAARLKAIISGLR